MREQLDQGGGGSPSTCPLRKCDDVVRRTAPALGDEIAESSGEQLMRALIERVVTVPLKLGSCWAMSRSSG